MQKTAKDIMTTGVVTTTPCATITLVSEIAKIMTDKDIKRVPVIDSTGRLIGIGSRADIVGAIGTKQTTLLCWPPQTAPKRGCLIPVLAKRMGLRQSQFSWE